MARVHISLRFPPNTRTLAIGKLPWNSRHPYVPAHSRQFSKSTAYFYPRKNSLIRFGSGKESTEYSGSGSDDQMAAMDDVSFNPDLTDPHSQKKKAGERAEDTQNPLDVSPASPEVSETRDAQKGGGTKTPDNAGASNEEEESSASADETFIKKKINPRVSKAEKERKYNEIWKHFDYMIAYGEEQDRIKALEEKKVKDEHSRNALKEREKKEQARIKALNEEEMKRAARIKALNEKEMKEADRWNALKGTTEEGVEML